MGTLPALTADCGSCAALCCIGLAFDKGDSFAIDKPAGQPCPNLRHHRCAIHADLTDAGFSGCVRFDCQGAGQRAVALHNGVSWQDDPDGLIPLLDSFRHLRVLHDLITLLETARILPLDSAQSEQRNELINQLCPEGMTPQIAEALANGPLRENVHHFLRGLGPIAQRPT